MAALGGTVPYTIRSGPSPVMQPVASDVACPLQTIEPATVHGHRGRLIQCNGVALTIPSRLAPQARQIPSMTCCDPDYARRQHSSQSR